LQVGRHSVQVARHGLQVGRHSLQMGACDLAGRSSRLADCGRLGVGDKLSVPTADFKTSANGKRQAIADTFAVLVVGR
jgi:hypothetical protein